MDKNTSIDGYIEPCADQPPLRAAGDIFMGEVVIVYNDGSVWPASTQCSEKTPIAQVGMLAIAVANIKSNAGVKFHFGEPEWHPQGQAPRS